MSSEVVDAGLARALQERAARAQPAEHVERVGDWWLRHTGGPSWWTGTVLAHGEASEGELIRRIDAAERFYARFDAATAFQLTPGVCAAALDGLLAERGYELGAPLHLLTAPADRLRAGDAGRVRLDTAPTPDWLDTWHAVNGGDRIAEAAMLARVDLPTAYATALPAGEAVAVGRAVLDDGWAGVFGMATLPGERRTGSARAVLRALADWAAQRGAQGLYLQVEGDNAPARALYARAGFTEAARYSYRSRRR
ncbi:GNAT family N-acetyltransferase [Naasia sp. SYSU D00057]|uniref:GNAT family N-acetyltransferase n=1 Tax=Naasia sp. SYSU D00057 TaxID=2817380 RepID=UPI001B30053D|nr:GNAT family N-acetyltransferase [Naasia sp. SYSU D00057]